MLKSRLYQPAHIQQPHGSQLLGQLLDTSNIYEYLLDSYDFVKLQGMAMKLWDRHTNVRKYRFTMKNDFPDSTPD